MSSEDILKRLANRFNRYMTLYEETGNRGFLKIAMDADRLYQRARAWDEGYNAGLDDFIGDVRDTPNPYRIT